MRRVRFVAKTNASRDKTFYRPLLRSHDVRILKWPLFIIAGSASNASVGNGRYIPLEVNAAMEPFRFLELAGVKVLDNHSGQSPAGNSP